MDGPKSVTATWRADVTVLYLTVALVIVAVAVVVGIGAFVWGRREYATDVHSPEDTNASNRPIHPEK